MNLDWQLVSEDEPIKMGWRKLRRRIFRLPDGKEQEYFVKDEGKQACVMALTEDGKVIVARQYRPGPMKVFDELPGGFVGKDEDPKDAILRELLEETGYEPKEIEHVVTYPLAPYSTGYEYVYLATSCRKVAEPKRDETEFLEIHLMPLPEFLKITRAAEMSNSNNALYAIERLRERGML